MQTFGKEQSRGLRTQGAAWEQTRWLPQQGWVPQGHIQEFVLPAPAAAAGTAHFNSSHETEVLGLGSRAHSKDLFHEQVHPISAL